MKAWFKRMAWVLWRRRRFGDQSWRFPIIEEAAFVGGPMDGCTSWVQQGCREFVVPMAGECGGVVAIRYLDRRARVDGRRSFAMDDASCRYYLHYLRRMFVRAGEDADLLRVVG